MSIHPETVQPFSTDIILEPVDNQRLANLCGPMDEHLRQLERRLGVEINNRGNTFRVIGDAPSVELVERVIKELYAATDHEILSPERVHLFLKDSGIDEEDQLQIDQDVFIKTKRGVIKGRSPNQKLYLKNILSHDICFGVGPAGTGKTYLAVACAIAALEHDHARRLVLVRPAVEAGEKLGFLPGDLVQKVDPYLRPLYDALYEMLGFERVAKYMERNVIEVAPLAFMRGRTLNESFVILDEAQNTTIEQMKMFLTRIGFNSTAVVTGDITQTDLPRDKKSGLRNVIDILKDEEGISFTFFKSRDVVRHPLVARILNAYERYENIKENPRERSGADNEDKG
ncbi:MAG: phosphate starvation-inducible protein PhoH [Gammaproteobacteria bacterium RIFCSPLOWO2_02_47_7]|nr:MAG: phosphate starvation-inducible protein PhoH [Gammaproteobacteria bacterium RIFCSPLOWO2_01_FULL_47_190]OGT66148.1 MAG: phosphate starvation-inducible protein PhoH [Gammaproteobacteria bacterium RIFCSPLOWO2_02_47_7]OGT71505.1 MAG: phosphate starvation-inducible protein PhoH [Gammaproteobacteria bacterium RIFCSPLOWO2_12_47_11]OGT82911.1 MAG: phosphate starvation-inducible protein PhoH [Gammaproteobacteria bacterium RIFCSPLOWO2_12_FULL_47_76]